MDAENCVIFRANDLSLGYNELRLSSETSKLLAVVAPDGIYKSLVLTLGPKQAPAVFQKETATNFGTLRDKNGQEFCGVYIDDLAYGGRDFDDFFFKTEKILKKCVETGFRLSLKKTQLAQSEIDLLGFKISSAGRSISLAKAQQVHEWPEFTTSDDLHSFFCLVGYLREFIPEFTFYHDRLKRYWLDKKEFKNFRGDEEAQKLVQELKDKVGAEVFMSTPDYDNPEGFEVLTDASDIGYSWCIAQYTKGAEVPKPVMFKGKSFSSTQRNWSTLERELYAILDFIRYGYPLIKGFKIRLRCDRKNAGSTELETIISKRGCKPKILRWEQEMRVPLAAIERVWIPGEENIIADVGSRLVAPPEKLRDVTRPVRELIKKMFDPPGKGKEPSGKEDNKEFSDESASSDPGSDSDSSSLYCEEINPSPAAVPPVRQIKAISYQKQEILPQKIFHQQTPKERWVVKYRNNKDGSIHTKGFNCEKSCDCARKKAWGFALDAIRISPPGGGDEHQTNYFHGTPGSHQFFVFDKPEGNVALDLAGIVLWDDRVHGFEQKCDNSRLLRKEFMGGIFCHVYECLGHGSCARGPQAGGEIYESDREPLPEKPRKKTVFFKDEVTAESLYRAAFLRPCHQRAEQISSEDNWEIPPGATNIRVVVLLNKISKTRSLEIVDLTKDEGADASASSQQKEQDEVVIIDAEGGEEIIVIESDVEVVTEKGVEVTFRAGRAMQFGVRGSKILLGAHGGAWVFYDLPDKNDSQGELPSIFPSAMAASISNLTILSFQRAQREDKEFGGIMQFLELRENFRGKSENLLAEYAKRAGGIKEARKAEDRARDYRIGEDGTLLFVRQPSGEGEVCIPTGGAILMKGGTPEEILVPWRQFFISSAHLGCMHGTAARTLAYLKIMKLYWPSMGADVDNFVLCCVLCKAARGRPDVVGSGQTPIPDFPFRVFYLDHVGPFKTTKRGNKYLLTAVCGLTGFGFIIPCKTKELKEVAELLIKKVFLVVGFPEILRSDRGFTGAELSKLRAPIGALQRFGSAYRPQAQWPVESPHREIGIGLLATVVQEDAEWDLLCPHLQFIWRSSPISSLDNLSPFRIIYGFDPALPPALFFNTGRKEKITGVEYADRIFQYLSGLRSKVIQHRHINSDRAKERSFNTHGIKPEGFLYVGDHVLITIPGARNSKEHLELKNTTKVYEVVEYIPPHNYLLCDPITRSTTDLPFSQPIHGSRLVRVLCSDFISYPNQSIVLLDEKDSRRTAVVTEVNHLTGAWRIRDNDVERDFNPIVEKYLLPEKEFIYRLGIILV